MTARCDTLPEGHHATRGICSMSQLCDQIFELKDENLILRRRSILDRKYTETSPIQYFPVASPSDGSFQRGIVAEAGEQIAPSANVEAYENEIEFVKKHQSYLESVFIPMTLILLLLVSFVTAAYGIRFTKSKRTRAALILLAIFRVVNVVGIWIVIELVGPCWSEDSCNHKIEEALQVAFSTRGTTAVHLWQQPVETKICGGQHASQVLYKRRGVDCENDGCNVDD
jgi:hypothetical protein